MQGAPPLASPGLNPGGTWKGGEPRARRGLVLFAACHPCRSGTRRGACLSPRLPTLPLVYFPAPYPPPPSPVGKGESFSLFRRGLRPRHPGIKPLATLTVPAVQVPSGRNLRFAAKPKELPFLLAVPAAKERGDRGRGTSAFEMVLSPGAGIASAARVQVAGMQGAKPLA